MKTKRRSSEAFQEKTPEPDFHNGSFQDLDTSLHVARRHLEEWEPVSEIPDDLKEKLKRRRDSFDRICEEHILRKKKEETRYKYLKRNTELAQSKTEINTICIEFTKEWADYTCGLFRKNLTCLSLSPNSSTHEILSITDWINKKQSTLEFCEFSGDDANSESINLFFEKRKVSIGNLSFGLRQEYGIRPLKFGVLDVDEFFVSNRSSKYPVNWLTVDDIMISFCRIIKIEACSFDENDINRILKGWLNGNNSQLESFTVVLKMLNFQLVLDGIDFERKDETLKRSFEFEFAGKQCTHQFTGGFDIRRKDGSLATIQQRYHFPSDALMFWFMM
ncbi:hypothetical protein CRE_14429, partial [Caenorhabditis remanei]